MRTHGRNMTLSVARRRTLATFGFLAGASLLRGRRARTWSIRGRRAERGTLTCNIAQMSGEVAEAMGKRFTRSIRDSGVAIRTTGQVAYERLTRN